MYGMGLTTKSFVPYRDKAVRAEASNAREYAMNNDNKILAVLTNEIPDSCPNCGGNKELYGGYATDFDIGIIRCKKCACLIFVKEDLTNENSTKPK